MRQILSIALFFGFLMVTVQEAGAPPYCVDNPCTTATGDLIPKPVAGPRGPAGFPGPAGAPGSDGAPGVCPRTCAGEGSAIYFVNFGGTVRCSGDLDAVTVSTITDPYGVEGPSLSPAITCRSTSSTPNLTPFNGIIGGMSVGLNSGCSIGDVRLAPSISYPTGRVLYRKSDGTLVSASVQIGGSIPAGWPGETFEVYMPVTCARTSSAIPD